MTSYYILEPEVAGGFGDNTVLTNTPGKRMVVHKLHYEFEVWLGDELVSSIGCFVVSERLARLIDQAGLTGVAFGPVEITKSELFEDLDPGLELPSFVWLKVDGMAGRDDFGIAPGILLVVSERALDLLKQTGLAHAEITPFKG